MGGRTGSGACLDEQDILELSGQANPDPKSAEAECPSEMPILRPGLFSDHG